MLKLTVVAPMGADVPEGTRLYKLSPDQVRRRAHKLKPETEGEGEKRKTLPLTEVAIAAAGIMFKKGEELTVGDESEAQLASDAFVDNAGNTLAARHMIARDKARKAAVAKLEAEEKRNPPTKRASVTERAVK